LEENMFNLDTCQGSFMGLALGDALGASHEGGAIERLLWGIIGKTKDRKIRWTDDTGMSIDVAISLIENMGVVQDSLARQFADSYKRSRGYGPGTAKMLKKIKKGEKWQEVNQSFPGGSYGNGAAMRAPVIAMYFHDDQEKMMAALKDSSVITHAHPLAVEGARIIAAAVSGAFVSCDPSVILSRAEGECRSQEYINKLNIAKGLLEEGEDKSPPYIAAKLGNGIAAIESCMTSVYIALRFLDEEFMDMIDFINKCKGDTDTIASMAGAIWGACNGIRRLDPRQYENLEFAEGILDLAKVLYQKAVE